MGEVENNLFQQHGEGHNGSGATEDPSCCRQETHPLPATHLSAVPSLVSWALAFLASVSSLFLLSLASHLVLSVSPC